jgi:hypothetical protein
VSEPIQAMVALRKDIRELHGDVRVLRAEMNRRLDQLEAKFHAPFGATDPWLIRWNRNCALMITLQLATLLSAVAWLLTVYSR